MSKYGMPYKGSKDKIAEKIISILPDADCFVDLFGGGGAMSHCAAMSGKYKKVIYNEFEPLVYKGFVMAINGEFSGENRWISRKDFLKLKDSDPYVAMCFSFGNNLKTYAYSPEIERFKKHLHYMFFAETPKEARLHWKAFINEFQLIKNEIAVLTQKCLELCSECNVKPIYNFDGTLNTSKIKKDVFKAKTSDIRNYMRNALDKSGLTQSQVDKHLGNQMSGHYFGQSQWTLPTLEQYRKLQEILPNLILPWSELNEQLETLKWLDSLQSLESLESLERLERLQRLQQIKTANQVNIECFNLSYEQVDIPENSVVYCDPPYKGTSSYISDFDHVKFYQWCRNNPYLIFVSEYNMPDDFFEMAQWNKTCTLAANNRTKTVEKLFCNQNIKYEKQLTL